MKLVDAGEPVPSAFELLLANSRTPREREGDLRAQLSAHSLADTRLLELERRVGSRTVREALSALLDYGERRTRAAIVALPDGTHGGSAWLEGDGVTDEASELDVAEQ